MRALRELHQLEHRLVGEVLERGGVLVRRDHHVAVVVGEGVEDHEARLAAVDDVGGLVVALRRLVAEDAPVRLGALDVVEPPRRPETLIRHRATQ